MARRLHQSTAQFVERFADAMVEAGMPRMPARVFAVLLTRDDAAATAAELATALRSLCSSIGGWQGTNDLRNI